MKCIKAVLFRETVPGKYLEEQKKRWGKCKLMGKLFLRTGRGDANP